MFSFFKRNKTGKQVPEWASFFDWEEYSNFIEYINNYFVSKSIIYALGDGAIQLKDESFGGDSLGLVNLAQNCKQEDRSVWKELISEHFDGMRNAAAFQKEFETKVHDFSYAEDFIGVRLYHKEYIAYIDESLTIGKQLTEDIFAMLIFDMPQTVVNIRPEQTIQWNKEYEELLEIGITNIRNKYEFDISSEELGEISIWFVQGNHFFVPNIIFNLKDHPELIGSKGCLIGLPHRHSALIYPIEDLGVVKAINEMIPVIFGMNEEGPGSLSNNLYWFYSNQFITLPYKLEENKLQFYPPEEFLDLLNGL